MGFLVCLTLLSIVNNILGQDDDLCHLPNCDGNPSSNRVTDFCKKRNETSDGRCCISHEDFITGLNLANCSLSTSDVLFTVPTTVSFNISNLHVLEFEGNNFTNCNNSLTAGMTSLQFISVPKQCDCPGGPDAWNATRTGFGTHCDQPINLCLDIECSNNSKCAMHSPGVPWCVCTDGYYGYKCLRQGNFDATILSIASAGSTVVLAIGLWFLLRRSVNDP